MCGWLLTSEGALTPPKEPMRTLLATAGVLTGLVLSTTPALAIDAHPAVSDKPVVTAEKDLPTGPRICLFSQNGRRAEPASDNDAGKVEPLPDKASQPATEDKHHQAAAQRKLDVAQIKPETDAKHGAPPQAASRQVTDRVCDTDASPAVPPHG